MYITDGLLTLLALVNYFDFLQDYIEMYLSFTKICLFKDCVLFHKH